MDIKEFYFKQKHPFRRMPLVYDLITTFIDKGWSQCSLIHELQKNELKRSLKQSNVYSDFIIDEMVENFSNWYEKKKNEDRRHTSALS